MTTFYPATKRSTPIRQSSAGSQRERPVRVGESVRALGREPSARSPSWVRCGEPLTKMAGMPVRMLSGIPGCGSCPPVRSALDAVFVHAGVADLAVTAAGQRALARVPG